MTYLAGIDVSKYNGDANLKGLAFAIVRATYGSTLDPKFVHHLTRFQAAGLPTGAYHFGVGGAQTAIAMQATAFLATTKKADFLALDMEANWLRRADGTRYRGPTMTKDEGRKFILLLRAGAPSKKVLLYSSRGTWPGDLGQDANWVADYTGQPDRLLTRPRIKWLFWQWQGAPLDRNKFNGDLSALRWFAGKSPAPVALPPVSTSVLTALRKLIANLAAVVSPTQAQKDKLALYKARLIAYLKRNQ